MPEPGGTLPAAGREWGAWRAWGDGDGHECGLPGGSGSGSPRDLPCGVRPPLGWGDPSGPPYPRLANVYLHGAVDSADIPPLARWDRAGARLGVAGRATGAVARPESRHQALLLRLRPLRRGAAGRRRHVAAGELQLRADASTCGGATPTAASRPTGRARRLLNMTDYCPDGSAGAVAPLHADAHRTACRCTPAARRRFPGQLLEEHRSWEQGGAIQRRLGL